VHVRPHWSTDLDAEPSCRACWKAGVFTLVSDAPFDQKNGSSCQVDCSSPVALKAIPYCEEVVRALASDWRNTSGHHELRIFF